MLILQRKPGERVILTLPDGTRIGVAVVRFLAGSSAVRLGFDAPRDVTIHREEVQQSEDAKALNRSAH